VGYPHTVPQDERTELDSILAYADIVEGLQWRRMQQQVNETRPGEPASRLLTAGEHELALITERAAQLQDTLLTLNCFGLAPGSHSKRCRLRELTKLFRSMQSRESEEAQSKNAVMNTRKKAMSVKARMEAKEMKERMINTSLDRDATLKLHMQELDEAQRAELTAMLNRKKEKHNETGSPAQSGTGGGTSAVDAEGMRYIKENVLSQTKRNQTSSMMSQIMQIGTYATVSQAAPLLEEDRDFGRDSVSRDGMRQKVKDLR